MKELPPFYNSANKVKASSVFMIIKLNTDGSQGGVGFIDSDQVFLVLNLSLVGLVLNILSSFNDESFSISDGFFQLSFLGSQDVGQSGLGVGDVSFSFVDQIGESSDFRIVFIGSSDEGFIGFLVFNF